MDDGYLRKLMDWAARSPISEIEVVDGDFRVHLVKRGDAAAVPAAGAEAPVEPAGGIVTAPLPGIFYLRASPDAPPFVVAGQAVRTGDTVGLIEAMKMFNPVASEIDGTVEAILVESGQEVTAGQPILRLKPAVGSRA